MHIQRLKIRDFRNLKDFEIGFTAQDPGDPAQDLKTHAVIGQNGLGKSNLIEAIITIFRAQDLNQGASFDYELDYSIRDHEISLVARAGAKPAVTCVFR